MSAVSPLINNWIENKLKWTWTFQPVLRPFPLAPGQKRQVPIENYIFRAPEGTLLHMVVAFDSPLGGMSMESEPNLDFRMVNNIQNVTGGGVHLPNVITYSRIPPDTPTGYFTLHSVKEWPWLEWCKLFVINSSTTQTIRCLGFGYTMAYLLESRRTTLLDIERLKLYQELYPDLKPEIETALKNTAKRQIEEVLKK